MDDVGESALDSSGIGDMARSKFRRILWAVNQVHGIFVMALMVSTILSGIVWVYHTVMTGRSIPIPLEIQAMAVFLGAFFVAFYPYNVRKLSPFYRLLGATLVVAIVLSFLFAFSRFESVEEKILITSSFIFGILGHSLYFRSALREKLEEALLLALGLVLVVVILLAALF